MKFFHLFMKFLESPHLSSYIVYISFWSFFLKQQILQLLTLQIPHWFSEQKDAIAA